MRMRRRKTAYTAAAILACMLFSMLFIAPESAMARRYRTSKKKPDTKLAKKIKDVRTKLKNTQKMEADVLDDLDRLDRSLDTSNRKLDAATLDLQRAQAQERHLQDKLETTEDSYWQYKRLVGNRLVSFYKSGRSGFAEAAFNAKSFEDFIGRVHYMRTIIENDRAIIETMRRQKDSLESSYTKIEEANNRIERLAWTIKNQKSEIEKERVTRKATLDKILNQKKYYLQSLSQMERESADIGRMIRSNRFSLPGGIFNGRLAVPNKGVFMSAFGWRVHPRYGVRRFHSGIDISCPTGTPVIASESGVVILSGWKRGYGLTVIIAHAGNLSTLYGHGSRVLVSVGDNVRRGDVIMYAGATGNATGPHVHYEVRNNGNPVDPMGYFK